MSDNITLARTLQGREPSDYLVDYRSVKHLLESRASETPDKVFLIHYDGAGERTTFTYKQFNEQVNRVANFLVAQGIKRGDRVATIAYNHSDTVLIYFACWKIGAAVAPQNVAEDDNRIAFILRNSEAVLALVRNDYMDRAQNIIHGTDDGLGAENIQQIIQVGGEAREGVLSLHTELAQQSTEFTPSEEPTLDDEALLVYTSGTTGAPKGVVLMQYNMLVDAFGISQWQAITAAQRMMCVLPIHHVNGTIVTLITPLLVGGSVVLNRVYSSSLFWERIAKENVHIVSVVPTLLQFSLEYADKMEADGKSIFGDGINKSDLKHFRHFICGAGTLSVSLARDFENRFGVPVLHGYGLSETTCYSCFLPIDLDWETHQHWMQHYGYPSIGSPIMPNEMGIFDPTGKGQQLGEGQRGEICIRGHNVMKHYFKRPDANQETFKFGWFRSGDEGFYQVDEQGRPFFFITGRIKELINRGGVKFSPFDIEEVLLEIDGVKVGLAIGFPNTYYGEEVGAYIVLEEGAALRSDDILSYCREKLTFEKAPKVVLFGKHVPVTSTGKYQRLKLREYFADWSETQFRK